MELNVITKQDINDDHLQVLLKDYELSIDKMEQLQQNILQILGIGTAALAVAIGYFIRDELSPALAWTAPLFFVVVYALVIMEIFWGLSYYWAARILTERINRLLPEVALTRHMPEYPASKYFSVVRGSLRVRLFYLLLISIAVGLLVQTIFYGFRIIYRESHLQATLFVASYAILLSIEMSALVGVLFELPKWFHSMSAHVEISGRMPMPAEVVPLITGARIASIRSLIYGLTPRPWDIVVKGVFFWYGYVIAYVLIGLHPHRLEPINALFSSSVLWPTTGNLPKWTVFALGLLYFILSEVMLQQAKLLWDDLRDLARDKTLPLNKRRALASGLMSPATAIRQMLFRLLVAFLGAWLLGGAAVTVVFLLVLIHQAIYALWAKPRGHDNPVRLLFVLAFNCSLRYLAGVVSVIGSQWVSPILGCVCKL